ncbi:MAG TPA: glycosyltransferase family 39 protein [Stellaceae bacterium]|nr:glycosyltransferase family 39 protein [Stellaceae bacterium]
MTDAFSAFRPTLRRTSGLAPPAVVLFLIVLYWQHVSGCYGDEFGEDATSHYISALVIHDYIRSGFSTSPVAFLEDFHAHYPLVGIGHWGPAFYGVEALWMLVFSTGRTAVLLLSAVMTTLTGISVYAVSAPRTGRTGAWFAAIGFVISPIIQEGSSSVMLDVPIAASCLGATMFYIRYIETERWIFAALFGVAAAFAMLIKGNGGLLALLPSFVVLFGWRWDLLAKWSFWLPVPIVAVAVLPWYVVTYPLVAEGFRYHWGIAYFLTATAGNFGYLEHAEGLPLLLAGIGGGIAAVAARRHGRADAGLICVAALAAAAWVFQLVVPAALQDRYLAPLLPPLLILTSYGVAAIGRLRWIGSAWAAPAVFGVLAISLVPGALSAEPQQHLGYVEAARAVWHARIGANPSILVAAGDAGEDAAIAELAMADRHRPSLYVVRGSRLLGGGGYNNSEYVPRFDNVAEVIGAIDAYAIPLVLLQTDPSSGAWAHVAQVQQAAERNADCWKPVFRNDQVTPPVILYALCNNGTKKADVAKLTTLSAPRSLMARAGPGDSKP